MTCSECSSEQVRMLESRPTARGERRRRYACDVCLYRWTSFEPETGKRTAVSFHRKDPSQRYLTRVEVIAILESDDTSSKLAATYDVPVATISKIQRGIIYKSLYEMVCRPVETNANCCESCSSWLKGRCGFGFPDAGGDFATDCAVYLPRALADVVQ